MREINASEITRAVEQLCISANRQLNADVYQALKDARAKEESQIGKDVLEKLLVNADLAMEKGMPMCQDTGMAVVFCEIGQDAHIVGGDITDAINAGVRNGYERGYLRKSVVKDPIKRANTGDNTPAIIHYEITKGENIKITVAPKGFGSENMSALAMLKPSDGLDGIKKFVLSTVERAGPNACPPIVIGVGIGGTMEKAALIAKQSLVRPLGESNRDEKIAALEKELLAAINKLGIGPAGLGGRITALAVHIEVFPTHIAGLPVAVNICCHALRHAEVTL
jgi:fumarate hydratase subunit alpha